jgi:hypothetical protein
MRSREKKRLVRRTRRKRARKLAYIGSHERWWREACAIRIVAEAWWRPTLLVHIDFAGGPS